MRRPAGSERANLKTFSGDQLRTRLSTKRIVAMPPDGMNGALRMPNPAEKLKAAADRFSHGPPGLGRPGFNPLFLGVLIAVLLALIAGLEAGNDELLKSNLVYRFVVGGVVCAVLYAVVTVSWLAWHRRVLKRLNVAGTGGETPDQGTAQELSDRDEEIKEFMETTTKAIGELANDKNDEAQA